MAITVVPLTTAVMGSVSDTKAGIASGINNSVTRISGTFINAILGAVVLLMFRNSVADRLVGLKISAEEKAQILLATEQLGEATAPSSLSLSLQTQVNAIYDLGFVHIYQVVGVVCGVLAVAASVVGLLMVETRKAE